MTLNEKCNTTKETPYNEKILAWIKLLGYENIKKCIPFSKLELQVALEQNDKTFSTLPLYLWELGAGFRNDFEDPYIGSELTLLYQNNGINEFTCTEGVCILKMVAFMWMNEKN